MSADRSAVRWRRASVADCLVAAEVNVRSWQESFADGRWRPEAGDLSVERRAEMIRRRFNAAFYRMYVAEAPGEGVVGFVDVGDPRDAQWKCDAELYAIYVLLRYQRSGVGQRLFELACDAVLAARRKSMYLIALEDNPYRSFYERLHGRKLGHRPAGAVPGQEAHVIYAWTDLQQYRASRPSPAAPDHRRHPPNENGRHSVDGNAPAAALLRALSGSEVSVGRDGASLDDAGWRVFIRDAFRHGIAPMVWDELRRNGRSRTVPPWALHDLERCYFRTRLANLRLYGRLREVLERFATHGLDVIVLKGAYLAAAVYEDRALRSMSDIDLLVRRDALARAVAILNDQGWQQPDAPAGDSVAGEGHQLSTFVRDGVQIEIHWNIEDDRSPFDIDVEALWGHARRVQIAGAPALALAPEDLLLHVCLHGSYNHGWLPFNQGLRPLRDVEACIAHFGQDLDWSAFTRRAREWKVNHCVWLALVLARDLLAVSVPDDAIARLAPPTEERDRVEDARELVLGDHYGDVLRTLPVLGRAWLTARWRRLPRATRWRRHLVPSAQTLASAYPSLEEAAKFIPARHAVHLADLGRDVIKLACSPHARSIAARERARLALVDWLEAPAIGAKQTALPVVDRIVTSG